MTDPFYILPCCLKSERAQCPFCKTQGTPQVNKCITCISMNTTNKKWTCHICGNFRTKCPNCNYRRNNHELKWKCEECHKKRDITESMMLTDKTLQEIYPNSDTDTDE